MTINLYRSIKEPIRNNLTWEEFWKGSDNGITVCWERGRVKAANELGLAESCKNGELPVLAWQGLRSEDLNINQDEEITIICSKTNVEVIFTSKFLTYETSKLEELES